MTTPTYYPPYVYANMKKFMNPDLAELLAWVIMGIEEDWVRGDGDDSERNFWADRVVEARQRLMR